MPVPASEVDMHGTWQARFIRRHVPSGREWTVERGFLGPRHFAAALTRWNHQQPANWHYRKADTDDNHIPRH